MNKSEKCYYAVIENKKRGKFYGAGPSQVAKKVASKKLKAGKEIEFYLDEVAGKKKRYGPYQARKDKKTGKVSVIKARKVMKGGVLSESDIRVLKDIFSRLKRPSNNNNRFLNLRLPENIIYSFSNEPILYLIPNKITNQYFCAVFKLPRVSRQTTEEIYLITYDLKLNIIIVNFFEYFLNIFIYTSALIDIRKKIDILNLIINHTESDPIKNEAEKILSFLTTRHLTDTTVLIYCPEYDNPIKKKWVYRYNFIFGIFYPYLYNTGNLETIIPENENQLFFITYHFFNGISEMVIYMIPYFNNRNYVFKYIIFTTSIKIYIKNSQNRYAELIRGIESVELENIKDNIEYIPDQIFLNKKSLIIRLTSNYQPSQSYL